MAAYPSKAIAASLTGVINKLLLLFIVLPLVEMTLLVFLGSQFGFWTTLLFIILTGVIGTWLAHSQGWSTYRRIQQELAQGKMPTDALIDGVLILAAGIMLLSPGVITDLLGIVLMIPPSRALCRRGLINWFKRHFRVQTLPAGPRADSERPFDPNVVDSYGSEVRPD
jgi:UPF0716 protein FxsA